MYRIHACINITSAGAVDREFVYIYIGPDWIPMSSNLDQIGAGLAQIGSQVDSTWTPGDPTGPSWDPTGSRARFGNLASSEVRSGRTRSAFWEHTTDTTGSGESAEVVAGPAARTPIPHAPGARMTVVTLTPSNKGRHKYSIVPSWKLAAYHPHTTTCSNY